MAKSKLLNDLHILGGPIDRDEVLYEPPQAHLQEVTRAQRHLGVVLNATAEEEFVDNLSAAIFHLERVKHDILCKPIPLVVKIGTVKIPYDTE